MRFPEVVRVKYEHNPLVEVVAQYVFVKPLTESDGYSLNVMKELHNAIKDEFPFFQQENGTAFSFGFMLDGAEDVSNLQPKLQENNVYHFSNAFDRFTVSREFIAFVTTKYDRWERFFNSFQVASMAFSQKFTHVNKFKRIGLRYKDVIERSKLNLSGVAWSELIESSIVPKVFFDDATLLGCNSVLAFELDEGKLTANIVSLQNAMTGEVAFMIDGDFFLEGVEVDYVTASEKLEKYNLYARNFFRWCITAKLHTALQPIPYQQ